MSNLAVSTNANNSYNSASSHALTFQTDVSISSNTALAPASTVPVIFASIVIVSYNSRTYLQACLESVLETTDNKCEIIVLDNASDDRSADFVATSFPQVKLIRNRTNAGFAGGNNLAVTHAQGEYIIGLNPDTVVTPGWLEALVAPLEQDNRVGLTTPRILLLREPEQVNTCGNLMHYTGLTICRGLGSQADAPELSQQTEVSAASGACFAIRRKLWQRLGGFDETFFTYLEDTDLSLRARLAGCSCVYVPNAVIYHDYTNRFSDRKLFYLERNRLLMLWKSYQLKTLLGLLPALLLTEIITWGYAIKSGRGGIQSKLQAWGWFITHWSEVGRKRRETQAVRQVSDKVLLAGLEWRLDITQLTNPKLARLLDFTINPIYHRIYKLFL